MVGSEMSTLQINQLANDQFAGEAGGLGAGAGVRRRPAAQRRGALRRKVDVDAADRGRAAGEGLIASEYLILSAKLHGPIMSVWRPLWKVALWSRALASGAHRPSWALNRCVILFHGRTQYAAGRDGGAAYAERKARLEARGFLVSGYEGMTPVQARNLLVLRLSTFGWTGCRVNTAPETPPTGTPVQRNASNRGSRFFSRSSSRQSRESSRSRDSL